MKTAPLHIQEYFARCLDELSEGGKEEVNTTWWFIDDIDVKNHPELAEFENGSYKHATHELFILQETEDYPIN